MKLNIKITQPNPTSALLEWDAIPDAVSYRIRLGKHGEEEAVYDVTNGGATSALIDNLEQGQRYWHKITPEFNFEDAEGEFEQ